MDGKLEITLVKSMIGRPEKHRRILKGMGLTKVGRAVVLKDTPAIRGMAFKVSHLVKIKGENNEAS
ncbi:50S ribosomal subunit protein L30 [Candidatus Desulfarcum epimagneticum]|uniref:50S ribosomal protein L30 n=1 Tax=uncultured Desulfobacteraceae bacterium TaxID=218296 RepID=A0A484HMI3_9BACT|nr:50S ribosomal subunit protein L30 [uncultured Desulfobacteraceae bacterium]